MDFTISKMALGTWTFAGDSIWGSSDEKECLKVISCAIDSGITLFDSAPNYGNGRSEEILGKGLKNHREALVSSKIKIDGLSPEQIKEAVYSSLRRLDRDRIDLMQIHWPSADSEETIRALNTMVDLKKSGEIRKIGVCNFGQFDLQETRDFDIYSNQIPYNLLWRVAEKSIGPASKDAGLRTIAYSPLQQGLLSGKYRTCRDFPEGRKRTRQFSSRNKAAGHGEPGMEEAIDEALAGIRQISLDTKMSIAELASAFVASSPFIDSVLIGARNIGQLEAGAKAIEIRLDSEIIDRLKIATDKVKEQCGGNPDMFRSPSRVRFTDTEGNPRR